jgi:hypothetical protein
MIQIVWMIIWMIKAHPTEIGCQGKQSPEISQIALDRYAQRMTVRDMLTALQTLPRDAELLAFEAGCEFSWRLRVRGQLVVLFVLVSWHRCC